MHLSLLTYNTLFNNAACKLDGVIDNYHPDIICLQEALTDTVSINKIEKLGYKMADYSNSFIKFGKVFGVITFYNSKRLNYKDSFKLDLGINLGDFFFNILRVVLGYNQPKTVLETNFTHKITGKKICICNVHLYVVGSNELRIQHIKNALRSINLAKKDHLVIVGDFNYFPYNRLNLEKMMLRFGMREATSNIRQTMKFSKDGKFEKYNWFQKFALKLLDQSIIKQIKTDYSFYRGLKLIKTERIESNLSDHYPIISTFKI